MVVSELPLIRLAVGRELVSQCEMLHALGTASAERRLDAGATPELLVLDMDCTARPILEGFLARLVERGFEGPRILLSAGFRTEAAARVRASCVTHFALGRPWRPGELRLLVESVLGISRFPAAARSP
ncbi:hypothetical protein DRW03_20840 [Corallococcus sp. H22C18031201]|uniref:hypothetical protein n=1 Tax=Citreicoccus inhibens TaxID=2849499 RepID=UPI000E734715|nr:hypothetical protein [Citreicoccus inhibens]MBU8895783.1 hypothetical protein [Citreicoccus inhibens]RJS20198.1 hypothetical protein DRW03_20840 [Corallococcus sp. H22C18031201]